MNHQSTLSQHPVDMMSMPFTGVAGYYTWYGYEDGTHFLWPATIRAKQHMNGDDVINTLSEGGGDWRQEKQYAELNNQNKKYAVEHQYYISQDQSSAVGYVKNRTFNIRTQSFPSTDCSYSATGDSLYNIFRSTSWNDVNNSERLRIDRLKSNTDYRVDWYSLYKTQSGGYMKSDCMNTNLRGGLWGFNLEYPRLGEEILGDTDFPLVWYVIHEGCNSGLAPLQPQFTHKSVLTALSINKNIWPTNGSHTMNMQNLGLMFNSKDVNEDPILSDYFGYPNLGRPNDHWQITPFEAVFVGTNIYSHINLDKALNADVKAINDFIKNEVEPCYLYLQNEHLGAQARSNYTYRSFRRANNVITTGNLVTPSTDPGDYVVEANTELVLEAGQQIVLKPGTHIKAGAKVHLKINYESCLDLKPCDIQGMTQNNSFNEATANHIYDDDDDNLSVSSIQESENTIKLFPNPTMGNFTIKITGNTNLQSLIIYNFSGQLVDNIENINTALYVFDKQLKQGTYLVVIQTHDNKITYKKLVVL